MVIEGKLDLTLLDSTSHADFAHTERLPPKNGARQSKMRHEPKRSVSHSL
jgi:hypothetical protein